MVLFWFHVFVHRDNLGISRPPDAQRHKIEGIGTFFQSYVQGCLFELTSHYSIIRSGWLDGLEYG